MKPPPATSLELRLLLATSRPAVVAFFESLSGRRPAVRVDHVPVTTDVLEERAEIVEAATAAVVDLEPESLAAIRLCEELRAWRPTLPVTALLCCPHSATPWNLRALVAAGVTSMTDLQLSADEALRALEAAVRGEAVLRVQLGHGHRMLLRDILASERPKSETQLRLLGLVALGLPDREIGKRLHLSPHTVKHHIEQLRNDVGARNRTELAAWAGRHGFYPAGIDEAS